jgi:DNA-binding FadR family transcriptional regulator
MQRSAAVAAVFEPVQTPTTFEETVERLGSAIRLGLLAPGHQLPPERELAEQLGISRSTLRQAITTLVQSGHLKSVRGRGGGTFVVDRPPLAKAPRGPLPENWREVLDLRLGVELGAAVLAAERATEDDLERTAAFVAQASAAPDFRAYRRADVGFHLSIAEASRAPRLITAMTEVQREVTELIAHIAHPPEVLAHANDEHGRLLEALRRHDATGAARLVRRHVEGTEHILSGLRSG